MKPTLILLFCLCAGLVYGQQTEQRTLNSYDKLSVHPYIDVELDQGSDPKVFIVANNWDTDDVIVEQKGSKVVIYLKGAKADKINTNANNWKKYRDVRVKVILTYEELKQISMKGDGTLTCWGPIEQNKFKLSLMGDCEASFDSWEVGRLKASVMGDTELDLGKGKATSQVWSIFGDSEINASSLKGDHCKIRAFGNSDIQVFATNHLQYKVFGESEISYKGNPHISASMALGESKLNRIK